MKKLFTLLAMAIIAISASAQISTSNFPESPSSYSAKQSALAIAPTSACNKGVEPFTSFLKKWNTNATFRKERVMGLSDDWNSAEENKQNILNGLNYLTDYKVLPVAAKPGKYGTFRTFFGVTANTVGYSKEGVMIHFQRVDGKWYVTFLGLAG